MQLGVEVVAAGSALGEGQGGASGYIEGLIPALLGDERIKSLVVYVARWYQPAKTWEHTKLEVRPCSVPRSRPLRVAYEQIGIPLQARRDRIDVLFSTGNFRPLAYRRPNVVALHAVQHFLLRDNIGRLRSRYIHYAVPRSLRTADLVVAVSETLRRDAIDLFGLDPDKIVAVPMGPSPWVENLMESSVPAPHAFRTPDGSPYVFCISRLYALKNHRRLIEAFARVIHQHQLPHSLVIAGGDADVRREELAELAARAGISERVWLLGRVPQADVHGLYAGADAVAYPSLYETFGHPVLEAFATGRPLITSSVGGAAEIAGGAGRLVDPTNVEDIAMGLHDVLTDVRLREQMIEAGHKRLQDFSWQRCAKGTIDALSDMVQRRS